MAFGAGPDATPLPIGVEIFIGGSWVNITADVILMDPIEIHRGRPDEGSSVEPSSMSLTPSASAALLQTPPDNMRTAPDGP